MRSIGAFGIEQAQRQPRRAALIAATPIFFIPHHCIKCALCFITVRSWRMSVLSLRHEAMATACRFRVKAEAGPGRFPENATRLKTNRPPAFADGRLYRHQ